MKSSNRTQPGFTLVEMIVSLSIIALVSSLTLVNYHEANQTAKLNAETYKLANLIREVQDWSLGMKEDQSGQVPGAWGLEFSSQAGRKTGVRILRYDVLGGELSAAAEERTVYFADGVTVGQLEFSGVSRNKAYLAFIPPDPVTFICADGLVPANCLSSEFEIILHDRFSSKNRSIKINTFGLIDVN